MEQFSTVRLQIWTVHMISGYLHLKIKNLHIGHIWATFGVLTLFGAQKLRGLITFEATVKLI